MKGIVLAGGSGTRLHPITHAVSKQLLPVFDKPMIYYPLSVLMLAGIRDILLITTPHDHDQFVGLLGDGSRFGVSITYKVQPRPDGLAQAFIIGADHVGDESAALVLGDNIFFGHGMSDLLTQARDEVEALGGCSLFGYRVADPQRYGVAVLDSAGDLVDIEEKPLAPKSNLAVTGLYFYDAQVCEIARSLKPSPRGELEITDLNRVYLAQNRARLVDMGRGTAWLDTGTEESLMAAGQFVQVLQQRQGVMIACLEEIAVRQGFISVEDALEMAYAMGHSRYAQYIRDTAKDFERVVA
jgi:glucose-1-phosphate thymidylyltransferase